MRIDKYMKVSRLIKRRTVAQEACDGGRVSVNGKPVKAAYNVKPGDIIEISFGSKKTKVKVEKICDFIKAEDAGSMYSIL